MGWELVFSPRSEDDLKKIVSYISKDDRAAAIRFGETLISKAESLASAPEMGPVLPQKSGTRFLPVGAYLIIYRAMNGGGSCEFLGSGTQHDATGRRGETSTADTRMTRGSLVFLSVPSA